MSPRDHKPRIDIAQLAGLMVETALNGVFWVMLIQTAEALWFRARQMQESVFKPMTFTAMALFCAITGHWLVDVLIAWEAYLLPSDVDIVIKAGTILPAEKVWLALSDPKAVMGSAFYVLATVIGDSFMIYRLYIVWGRNPFIIIFPVLLTVALTVTGGMVTYLFSQAKNPIFKTAGPWITACFSLTFVCNFYSTLLIASKIWLSNRQFGRAMGGNGGLPKLVEILVESAALYSATVLTALATYVSNSNAQFIIVCAANPVIGIIFCMIVLRVQKAAGGTSSHANSRGGVSGGSHPLRPVAIKITTQSQLDTEASYPKSEYANQSFMEHGHQSRHRTNESA